MFLNQVNFDPAVANEYFASHPLDILDYLEQLWAVGAAEKGAGLKSRPQPMLNPGTFNAQADATWHHIVYAHMIENTRIVEIFRRVLTEYALGERLGTPSLASQNWLRASESVFYADPGADSIVAIKSQIRPDARATRRNAYYRMFGMDLLHGNDDNTPYPYVKAKASNRDFATVLESLLREAWVGVKNSGNSSGGNPTDDARIAENARLLRSMMADRRKNGNLSREEFSAVVLASWLHLTVYFDSQIVKDLNATATTPAERLRKIGERVGLPPHSKSDDYFGMAEPLSALLLRIESGDLSESSNARVLYAQDSDLRPDVVSIVNHWSSAKGRSLKSSAQAPATVGA